MSDAPRSARFRNARAALLALFLGILCLGEALLPGRALLPQPFETVAAPALHAEMQDGQLSLPKVPAPTREAYVPHRKDKLLQFYPFDTWVGDAWRAGEVPLWTPHMLCGLPLLAQGTARAFYPSAAVFAFVEPSSAYAWLWLAHLTLAGLFAYRLARRFGALEEGGLLACGTIVLSGYACAHVQHPMIFIAALWALPALEATFALLRPRAPEPKRWRPMLALAFSVALSWFAGFAQASVLLAYLVLGLCVALSVARWRETGSLPWRALAWPAAGLGLGILLGMVQILPMLEMAAHASRKPADLDTLRELALPLAALLEFVLPGQLCVPGEILVGTDELSSRPSFLTLALLPKDAAMSVAAGTNNLNHTEIAFGIGFWPLAFALLTLRRVFARGLGSDARALLVFLQVTLLVGLLGALALPGLVHVLHVLPGFAVGDLKRLLMLPALALPILAGLGWQGPRWPGLIPVATGLGIVIAILGITLLALSDESFARGFGSWIAPRYDLPTEAFLGALGPGEANQNHFWLGKGILLGGLAIALGPLLARELRLGSIGFLTATLLTQLPIAWDATPAPRQPELSPFARSRWTSNEAEEHVGRVMHVEQPPAGRKRHAGDQRLGTPYLGPHDAVSGYAPLAPARIERYFESVATASVSNGAGVGPLRLVALQEDDKLDSALRRAGVTHLVSNVDLGPPGETGWKPNLRGEGAARALANLLGSGGVPAQHAIPYRRELGKSEESLPFVAWFPEALVSTGPTPKHAEDRFVKGADRFFDSDGAAKPPELPVLLAPGMEAPAGDREGEPAKLFPIAPSGAQRDGAGSGLPLRLRYQAADPGWLFVAYTWMPGFEFRIDDGEWQETARALIAFQACPMPKGEHVFELRYRPASFRWGAALSLLALLTLLAVPLVPRLSRITRLPRLPRLPRFRNAS